VGLLVIRHNASPWGDRQPVVTVAAAAAVAAVAAGEEHLQGPCCCWFKQSQLLQLPDLI